jgi:cytochrome c-type biogenesis protein
MESLFTALSDAMAGSYFTALAASFIWGVLSILLSPCHLTSIPLVIGFLSSQQERKPWRDATLSLVFAAGILATIAIIGIITAALGRLMGDIGIYGKYAVAGVFFIFGLYLMDVIRLPGTGVALRPPKFQSPYLSALMLGLVFGTALGPCTFAFMAPVFGAVFQLSDANIVAAALLLLAFGLGHAGVIALAGGLTTRVQAYLAWTNRSRAVLWTKRVAGFLVVLGGVYAIYSA